MEDVKSRAERKQPPIGTGGPFKGLSSCRKAQGKGLRCRNNDCWGISRLAEEQLISGPLAPPQGRQ